MTQKNSSGSRETQFVRRRRSVLEFGSKEEKKLLTGPATALGTSADKVRTSMLSYSDARPFHQE